MSENEGLYPLPDGWVWTTLGEVAEVIRGVSYPKTESTSTNGEGLVPILRATNIVDDTLVLDEELVFVSEALVKAQQFMQQGDVLICMSSGSKHLVGKTAELFLENWRGSFGTFCAVLRPHPGLAQSILGYFTRSREYRSVVSAKSIGVNINNLKASDITSIAFPLAPLPEQRRIVDEIETQFSRLDAAEAALRRVQGNLKRYRASVLKAACEGRLVPTEAELATTEGRVYEPASILLERILAERRAKWQLANPKKAYKEPAGPDVENLPELPEGWVWASFAQVAEIAANLTDPKDYPDTPHIAPNNIESETGRLLEYRTIAEDGMTSAKHGFHAGQILYSKIRPYLAKATIVDFDGLCSADMYPIDPSIDIQYLHKWIISPEFTKLASSQQGRTVLPKINSDELRGLPVPVPPLREQVRIVRECARIMTLASVIQVSVGRQIGSASSLREAILRDAYSGRLVQQDPSEESALGMLSRFRQVRISATGDNSRIKQKHSRKTIMATPHQSTGGLFEILTIAARPIPVRELFEQGNFKPETVEGFYGELKREMRELGRVRQLTHDSTGEILLEAVKYEDFKA